MICLRPEETIIEEKFGIEQDKNQGNYKYTVKSRAVEIALKVYRWQGNVKNPANSRIIIKRITYVNGDRIEETLIDGVDDSALIRDYDIFEHEYEITVIEAGVEVEGVVKYIKTVGLGGVE